MTRFTLSTSNEEIIPKPWGDDFNWNRTNVVSLEDNHFLLVKLASGGLQNAVVAPLRAFLPTSSKITDVTSSLLPLISDFAVTRDVLVADLNADGYDDFFLSNHGPEPIDQPFPGENNAIYIYQPSLGSYKEIVLEGMDFSHGSVIGDFEGDGLKDIYVGNLGSSNGFGSYILQQKIDGSFVPVSLADSYVSVNAPMNASIDVNNDGKSEIASIDKNGSLVIWENITSSNPSLISSPFELPISERGVFAMESADFDSNGKADILIVGTGDEIQMLDSGENVVTLGGTLKALLIFDAGLASQYLVEPLLQAGINFTSKGGQQVEVVDIDNSGTIDLEIRTYDENWNGHRFTVFIDKSGSTSTVENLGGIGSAHAAYIDVNSDNVLDLVAYDGGMVSGVFKSGFTIKLGEMLNRVDGVAYDIEGSSSAGGAYRLYQAALDRAPDTEGLGYWIDRVDNGVALESMAFEFINSSEFESLYGPNPTNTDFITLLYNNVLNREFDQGGYDYWMGQLDGGLSRGGVIAGFSESPENQANVISQIENGMQYDLWLG